ncbi:MAG: hypothetical protein R3234_00865 [Thermoanaerobaculia bacterium]|nr:hypothetical protein [Thermoanaerobaculia bacterium]
MKIAIVTTVVQWILLAEGLRGSRSAGDLLEDRASKEAVAKP